MTTRELIESLPANIRFHVEKMRKEYKSPVWSKDEVRAEIAGYAKGLRDAGILNDRERGMLYIYCCTVFYDN